MAVTTVVHVHWVGKVVASRAPCVLLMLICLTPLVDSERRNDANEVCDVVLSADFDAQFVGTMVAPTLYKGNFSRLLAAQRTWSTDVLSERCLLNPTFYLAVSAIWRIPDERGGRNLALRWIATAQRLISDQSSRLPSQSLPLVGQSHQTAGIGRVDKLMSLASRLVMADLGQFCRGLSILQEALIQNPEFLPAYVVGKELVQLAALVESRKGTHSSKFENSLVTCVQQFAAGLHGTSIGSAKQESFLLCQHVHHWTAQLGQTYFSARSASLGYVGWVLGLSADSCTICDVTSTSFVLGRLVELEKFNDRLLFLDVGGGVGEFALLAAHCNALTVHAFEPNPLTRAELDANAARNGVSARVVSHGIGLSNFTGQDELIAPQMAHGHASFASKATTRRLDTPFSTRNAEIFVRTLDQWWADFASTATERWDFVSMIKIDTEGAELLVLQGGASVIQRHSPEIFLEFSDHTYDFGYHPNLLVELLNSWGYIGRNWGDGNAHFIRVPLAWDPRQMQGGKTAELYCRLVQCEVKVRS